MVALPSVRRAGTIAASAFPPVAIVSIAVATLVATAACAQQPAPAAAGGTAPSYARASSGTRWLEGPGVSIKVLVEASNFAGDAQVEVAELRLEQSSAEHRHTSHEIIYVLEGVLEHVVNGETHRIEPGMVGVVREGDMVVHRVVGTTPVRALLVWAPGGEADRLARVFETRPVEAAKP